jgi:hypothetical protein
VIDEAEWAQAGVSLAALAKSAQLIARLADQGDRLNAWRMGDALAGVLVADALDQLSGLLDDSEFFEARRAVAFLVRTLPPGPEG